MIYKSCLYQNLFFVWFWYKVSEKVDRQLVKVKISSEVFSPEQTAKNASQFKGNLHILQIGWRKLLLGMDHYSPGGGGGGGGYRDS